MLNRARRPHPPRARRPHPPSQTAKCRNREKGGKAARENQRVDELHHRGDREKGGKTAMENQRVDGLHHRGNKWKRGEGTQNSGKGMKQEGGRETELSTDLFEMSHLFLSLSMSTF